MELASELDFSRKRQANLVHNRKQEIVVIEEARQELHHQEQLQSKYKEKMKSLGGLFA